MVSRPMAWLPSPGLLRVGEEEALMTEGPRTAPGTLPSDARRPDRRREAAVMGPKEAAWLAWYMCGLSLMLTVLGLVLLVLSREHHGVLIFEQWAEDAVVAIGFSTIGAFVAPRFPSRNPIGWLFCAIGLVGAMLLFCGEYAAYSLVSYPGTQPSGEAAAWVASWLWVAHVGLFAFLGLLYPDGRPPSPRWRPFAWLVAAVGASGSGAAARPPGPGAGAGRGARLPPQPFGHRGLARPLRLGGGSLVRPRARGGGLAVRAAAPVQRPGAPAGQVVRLRDRGAGRRLRRRSRGLGRAERLVAALGGWLRRDHDRPGGF